MIKVELMNEAKINKLVDEMQKWTGKEQAKVVRNLARDVARAALKVTPIAPVNAKVWKIVKTKDGRVIKKFIGRANTIDYSINRGFAKSGWSAVLTKLGVHRSTKFGGKANLKYGDVKIIKHGDKVEYRLANNIPFIERLDSGNYPNGKPANILERAMRNVTKQWDRRLTKMAEKTVKKFIGI